MGSDMNVCLGFQDGCSVKILTLQFKASFMLGMWDMMAMSLSIVLHLSHLPPYRLYTFTTFTLAMKVW